MLPPFTMMGDRKDGAHPASQDRAATPSGPSPQAVSGKAGIPCAGAWQVSCVRATIDGQRWYRIVDQDGTQEFAFVPFGDRTDEEYRRCTAHARLIAAAPDLYEALAAILECAFDGPQYDAAVAALAKARGEQ